jgi:hypothetical protein
MTYLAAKPSTSRAPGENRALDAALYALCATAFAGRKPAPIFLENVDAASHYRVMGADDAVRPARIRPPTADGKSRNPLDIRVASSICQITQDSRPDLNSTEARTEIRRADGREFTVHVDLVEHTMIGNPLIANDQQYRFSENIHAKYRKSAAVAPILHNCPLDRCVLHSDSMHDGGWGGLRDRGVTPNERSGR